MIGANFEVSIPCRVSRLLRQWQSTYPIERLWDFESQFPVGFLGCYAYQGRFGKGWLVRLHASQFPVGFLGCYASSPRFWQIQLE